MDLKQYIMLFKHWAWLLILGIALGIGAGYVISRYQSPIYQASTKVLIMRAPDANSGLLPQQDDQQLASTFTELLVTKPIIQATSKQLGYQVSAGKVTVQQARDAQLIQVMVSNTSPQRAAEIANTLVEVFLQQNEQLQNSRFASTEESLLAQRQQVESQMADLRNQLFQSNVQSRENRLQEVTKTISDIQAEIISLQKDIVVLDFPKAPVMQPNIKGTPFPVTPTPVLQELTDLTLKRNRLQELQSLLRIYQDLYVRFSYTADTPASDPKLNLDQIQAALTLYEQIYANLLSNYEAVRLARLRSTPNIVQVEKAAAPVGPVSPRPLVNMALGAIVGLLLTGMIAYLVEYLDDTLRTPEEVSEVLQLPVLGYIGEMAHNAKKNGNGTKPYVISQPRSPIAESFRSLRTNLEFTELDRPLKTILVTSAGLSEGKTTIALNLATVMAQAGKRVILLDADLRRPHIHTSLGLPNRAGLSDVLLDYATLQSVTQPLPDVGGLMVITSGKLPPNPVEVLSSEKMANILKDLKEIADLVVVDGPPFLLADASVLSSKTDGVLLVVQLNRAQASPTLVMLEQLERSGARVIGVALNRINHGSTASYYKGLKGYHYFAYESSDDDKKGNPQPPTLANERN